MGAYPQGGGKIRLKELGMVGYDDDFSWEKKPVRPDRYKSVYRLQRRFKMQVLLEELDSQKTKYYRTLDELEPLGDN